MHILLIGTSADAREWFKGGKLRHEIVAERLEAELGEPVTMTVKSLWPDERVTRVLATWIEKEQPDVIYMAGAAFWFCYRSVPLRMRRLLGPFGARFATAGFRFADSSRWAHNAIFRTIRGGLQVTIGGDTHFTPEEVIERMSECVRIALRHEGAALIVKGPQGRTNYARSRRGREANERKRRQVNGALAALCAQLHVTYEGTDRSVFDDEEFRGNRIGDGIHGDATYHANTADLLYRSIRKGIEDADRWPAVADEAVPSPVA